MGSLRRWLVLATVVAGFSFRWWVLRTPTGAMNADEFVTGLGSIEALNGRFDVVIPGGAYTANFESYLFAPFVAVFGAHVLPLKLMAIGLWGLACWLVWRLVRRVLGPDEGLMAGALLWLVPGALLVLSTRAYLAYPGGLAWISGCLLMLAYDLDQPAPTVRRSVFIGLLMGATIWAHPLYLAVLLPGAIYVTIEHRVDLKRWFLPAIGGTVLGLSPWLAWNVAHDFPSLHSDALGAGTYYSRLKGCVTGLLPRDLGLLNPTGTLWIHGHMVSLGLLGLVVALVGFGAIRLFHSGRPGRMLAVCLIAVGPIMALFPAVGLIADGRYGVIAASLVFSAMAAGATPLITLVRRHLGETSAVIAIGAVLIAWVAAYLLPYQHAVIGTQWVEPNGSLHALVGHLDDLGVERVAGSYWVVLPITYLSDGRIPSAVTSSLPKRYPHYQQIVESSDPTTVVFVFHSSNEDPAALMMPSTSYDREEFASYVLYIPKAFA